VIQPSLILAYHGIGTVPRGYDPHNLMTPPGQFRSQVERLVARGYEFVKMSELACRLHSSVALQGVCALTFDDGSADNAGVLPALLAALGVPGTVFVCPSLLGKANPFLAPESGARLMTADEVRAISGLPFIEVGSHTNDHRDLSSATADEAYREMTASKQALERLLDQPVRSFAYPFGHYSPACPAAAERAGYTSAVTEAGCGSWRPYELRRQSVNPLDGRLTFALKSRGVFYPLLRTPLGRLAAWVARPFRHPPDRSS